MLAVVQASELVRNARLSCNSSVGTLYVVSSDLSKQGRALWLSRDERLQDFAIRRNHYQS
jgi:hypothetical protein